MDVSGLKDMLLKAAPCGAEPWGSQQHAIPPLPPPQDPPSDIEGKNKNETTNSGDPVAEPSSGSSALESKADEQPLPEGIKEFKSTCLGITYIYNFLFVVQLVHMFIQKYLTYCWNTQNVSIYISTLDFLEHFSS